MSTFWTTLFLALFGMVLLFSGLFIVVIVAVALVGSADGLTSALRHHFGSHGRFAGTHYGNMAMNHH
jgi:amino acid permease